LIGGSSSGLFASFELVVAFRGCFTANNGRSSPLLRSDGRGCKITSRLNMVAAMEESFRGEVERISLVMERNLGSGVMVSKSIMGKACSGVLM